MSNHVNHKNSNQGNKSSIQENTNTNQENNTNSNNKPEINNGGKNKMFGQTNNSQRNNTNQNNNHNGNQKNPNNNNLNNNKIGNQSSGITQRYPLSRNDIKESENKNIGIKAGKENYRNQLQKIREDLKDIAKLFSDNYILELLLAQEGNLEESKKIILDKYKNYQDKNK